MIVAFLDVWVWWWLHGIGLTYLGFGFGLVTVLAGFEFVGLVVVIF